MMKLANFRSEMYEELKLLLQYWMEHTIDTKYGGFFGKIDEQNSVHPDAPKGSVLNSRILWTFAAAYNTTKNPEYLTMAERAYDFLSNYFIDPEWGGVYWTVDYSSKPLDTKKQVYASAFALYAMAEYYSCRKDESVKAKAIAMFETIEKYSFDPVHTGYIDAFARDWTEMEDIRLSAKDANEKKTMNTHLHVLEAYTQLYRIAPSELLNKRLRQLVLNFSDHFIDEGSGHLRLFFDENWKVKPGPISYGHDIEASWLLLEAAEVLGDKLLVEVINEIALNIAEAAIEGLDKDGGLWYERSEHSNELIKEKHWWPQAEAMVGFFNAYQISGDESYLKLSINSWEFIKKHIKDPVYGEWYWGVEEDYSPMKNQDKAGLWKCPYHNGRACLEIMKRVGVQEVQEVPKVP